MPFWKNDKANNSSLSISELAVLNLAMVCIATSGVLGRSLSIPPPLAIWWRAVFALLFLGIFCWWQGMSFQITQKRNRRIVFGAGLLFTAHWVTYFYALQWSNVPIAMLSVFTYPAMTTLLEPLILRQKFQKVHLWLAGLVLIGIYFLVPESFDLKHGKTAGLIMGLVSAFVYSVRNILMKTQVDNVEGSVLMTYQVAIAVIILLPVLAVYPPLPPVDQFPFLIALGLITTAIGHTLFLRSFQYFSISTASLISSIQPVYGIILGILFLGEVPGWRSAFGG
ncbi:MAG: DMT family transporter, partial [Bacteroidota bacterium]